MKNILYSLILFLFLSFDVIADEKKYLIIFTSDWCHFCKKAESDIESETATKKISSKYKIIYIDYDTNDEVIKYYKVKEIPTFIIQSQEKELNRLVGYNGINKLMQFLGLE